MEQAPDYPLARRVKVVASREVEASEAAVLAPPRVEIPAPPAAIAPILEEGDAPPVVDPTAYGHRSRKHHHQSLYTAARGGIAAAFACTVAAVVCVALGDRSVGQTIAGIGIGVGVMSSALALPTKLGSRVLGYAVASTVLAAICLAAMAVLPGE